MHELSIAMSIVDIATEYAVKDNADQVLEIEIEVGTLSGVIPEALEMAMEAATRNTLCESARWKINMIKAEMVCPESKKVIPTESLVDPCPVCGAFGHELTQGKELRVKSLLVE